MVLVWGSRPRLSSHEYRGRPTSRRFGEKWDVGRSKASALRYTPHSLGALAPEVTSAARVRTDI
jgi:hypothetical protein